MKNNVQTKSVLNKENTKVLNVIVKNAGITATGVKKKLRWKFTPTRALGCLRDAKFVLVDKKTKGYSVSAGGTEALAGVVKPKRVRTKKAAPIVPAEPISPADLNIAVEPAPVVNAEPALAEAAL